MKNLKEAKNCQIAGGAKKLTGVQPELMEKICREVEGEAVAKVLRIVKNGQVFYSKEYTRMVKRNARCFVGVWSSGRDSVLCVR